jgi:hypothetical protein
LREQRQRERRREDESKEPDRINHPHHPESFLSD